MKRAGDESVAAYSLEDLLYLMRRLRDPVDGCPWDREQDFRSIAPYTLEETYELVDAIESDDPVQIREELGDVLFQVVFYSQLASETDAFSFSDIVDGIVSKLVRRHPHVFPDGSLESRAGEQRTETRQVKQNWEQIKAGERRQKQRPGVLDDIPAALPALTRATKLQKRASRAGFDWEDHEGVLQHLQSELVELTEARQRGDQQQVEEEFGDLLFCMVNLARHWQIDAEKSLREANRKFERRFRYIENGLQQNGSSVTEATLETMDALWEEAKQNGL